MTRMLVVDDNRTNTKIIQAILKGAPFEIDVCLTPEEGLVQLTQGAYDVALVDLFMPNMSGIELVKKWIETRDPTDNAKIVFVTADSNFDPDKEGFGPIGASVVRKPFKPATLFAALQE